MHGDTPRYLVLGPVVALGPDGTPLDLGGAQRRAVLAKLVLNPRRVQSIEALADGLWAREPPPTALRSLQAQVTKLKKVLPDGELTTHRASYSLDVPPEATDLARFESAISRAAAARAEGDHAGAALLLRSGLALWRGAALSDLRSLPFVAGPVARLEEARRQATEARIEADLALGRHAEVVGELEAMVRDEPLREPRWALLMTALYRCGRQGEALDAYARARAELVEQLGLEPGPDLRRLELEILRQSLPGAPGQQVATTPGRAQPRRPRSLPAVDTPVVGRDEPLGAVHALFEDLRAGRGGVVAVRGDEGLGKTTLLRSVADRATPAVGVLAGRAREHLVSPYGTWIELLDGVDDELTALLLGADDDPNDPPELRRHRIFDAVVAALRRLAAEAPQLVVLDDLQWSDDASVLLLVHAVEELGDDRVLFLVAWRDREVSVGHPAVRFTHLAARRGRLTIDLGPLRPTDVVDLLAATGLRGDEVRRAAVAAAIHRATSGVPLFVADAVAQLAGTDGELPTPDEVAASLPETVRTLVARRLGAAGPGAVDVVEASAVLTDPFPGDLVQQLAPDRSLPEVLDALDRLVDVGLLRAGPGGFGFQHVAFRHAVVAEMRSGRRQMLHAAAHHAFRRAGAPPAVLVHHAETAGPLVARADLLTALGDAASDAGRRGAFADAALLHGRAVVLSEPSDRPVHQVAQADALWRAGDISAAKAVAAEVIALGTGADRSDVVLSEQVLTDAVVLHGTFGHGYGIDHSSLAAADAALEVVECPVQRARLELVRAYQHGTWGSPQPLALEAVARAHAALPDPCPDDVLAELLFTEAQALLGSPDVDRRRVVVDGLVALGERTGSWRDIGRGLRMRAFVQMSAGELEALETTLAGIHEAADRTGSWLYRADAVRWRVATALARGDDEQALAGIEQLERLAASPLSGRAFTSSQRPLRHWAGGDADQALAQVEVMRQLLPEDPLDAPDRRMVDLFRLLLLAELDRRDEAEAELHRLAPHRTLDQASCRRYVAELALTADLAVTFGLEDTWTDLRHRLEPFAGQLLVLSWGEVLLGAADRYLAELSSLQDGRLDEPGFARALEVEERAGATVPAARTKLRREQTVEALARRR